VEPNETVKRLEVVIFAIGDSEQAPVQRESAPRYGSFDEFYRAQYPAAVRLAWLLTRSSSGSEDLVQEAFLEVYRRFDGLTEPQAYLQRALANRCRSWQRREIVRRRARPGHSPHVTDTPSVPDRQLLGAVQRLSYRQRFVVVARYWADWSEQEIAAALDCRPGTVKSLSARALAQLHKEMS